MPVPRAVVHLEARCFGADFVCSGAQVAAAADSVRVQFGAEALHQGG